MSKMEKEEIFVEAEIVDSDFKAPVLQDIKYPVSEEYLTSLAEQYRDIPEIDLDADDEVIAEQFAFVLQGHKTLVKERNRIEKTRKAIKDPAYTFGNTVDAYAKKLKSIIAIAEGKLKLQRDRVEQNEARKQAEAEALEEQRVEVIQSKISTIERLPLEMMQKSSSDIREALCNFKTPTNEEFEEYIDKALNIAMSVQTQLTQMAEQKELVENAQAIQDEKDAEAKRLKDEEDAKHQAEKDKLAEEQAKFQRQKDEFEAMQREQQEILDRREAERLADELQAKQEQEKADKIKIDAERHDAMVMETMAVINSYSDNIILLDAIISNQVPNVKWVLDGN